MGRLFALAAEALISEVLEVAGLAVAVDAPASILWRGRRIEREADKPTERNIDPRMHGRASCLL